MAAHSIRSCFMMSSASSYLQLNLLSMLFSSSVPTVVCTAEFSSMRCRNDRERVNPCTGYFIFCAFDDLYVSKVSDLQMSRCVHFVSCSFMFIRTLSIHFSWNVDLLKGASAYICSRARSFMTTGKQCYEVCSVDSMLRGLFVCHKLPFYVVRCGCMC